MPWPPSQATFPPVPSTYSITMHRWRLVSKEQNMLTTKGFSAKVSMSRSTKACWIWFRRIRFCLLIFFTAKRCRVDLCRTRNTALETKPICTPRPSAPELCSPPLLSLGGQTVSSHTLSMNRTKEQGVLINEKDLSPAQGALQFPDIPSPEDTAQPLLRAQ